ncbi:hypothetical protein UFOVP1319_14 [uncultured Caudovirales phage]|uniref:Uncharacterized protein n=1 Tax=uncultured Caudovirales phage TaxID=2100421 RepID=A0A6J5ML66_9CAUD|nr:hypothetical protein UFOVP478_49 [uncultured Caudovirales phage]CAB4191325.1 hypothetical protein UFOVP1225_24 [uncultured Caudovirales phage]CAB4197428.1 hypothetical protein UFOVP1319_14 [uncultured Caudovirales phage]CAB4217390.1 hypothetical protein UFOVP1591_24 [uncultured Caudovirales phage]
MPNTPQEFPKKPDVSLQALEQKLAAFANESLAKTTTKEFEFNEICNRVMMQARVEFAKRETSQNNDNRQAFKLAGFSDPLPRPRVPTSTESVFTGQSDVPYVMGSSKDGSLVPGTWTAAIGLELAQTDTWDINNPPKNAGGVITRGVQGPFIRYWDAGAYYDLISGLSSTAGTCALVLTSNRFFVRSATYDSFGKLVAISAETAITGLNSTTTGSSTTAYLGAY